MTKPLARDSVDAVLEEHHALRRDIAELRAHLERPLPAADAPEARAWAVRLADRLAHFGARARRHFRAEEQSGLIDDLARSSPGAQRTATRLQGEHDRILEDLRRALDAATALARRNEPDGELRARVLAVLDAFVAHEEAENELMQIQLGEDLGAGD